jgi:predicted AAA+ superfamily ATPase
MSYQPRYFLKRVKNLFKQFPIVCLLGPRQCGKTTFVKREFSTWHYIDLESPSQQTRVAEDIEFFLERLSGPVIFDEAQQLPQLFSVLRSYVDKNSLPKKRILLLGSAAFDLIKNISESLAGRIGFVDMTPFQFAEVANLSHLWLTGGFPSAYLQNNHQQRQEWFEAFTRTFIERDLTRLGIDVSASQMRRLFGMLAHTHGGLWNASEIGSSLGVTYHTVNRYLDILEQTFLIRKLTPFYANIGKRLTKSPKIYFRDSGLLHYFLGIQKKKELDIHPKRGLSWEGFVIEQIINEAKLSHPSVEPYFWQTATKQEVDLILKKGSELIPIEVKTHSSPDRSMVPGLIHCLEDLGLKKGYVIYPGKDQYTLLNGQIIVLPLKLFHIENRP